MTLTEEQKTELLDWVSACQSAYHIESTPGHRFGGIGGQLQENRDGLVEYVESLLEAASAAPADEAMAKDAARYRWLRRRERVQTIIELETGIDSMSLIDMDASIDAAIAAAPKGEAV